MFESGSDKAARVRGAIRDWVAVYSQRRAVPCVGEFLDEDGADNPQFGIGGTCFVASLEAWEGLPVKFGALWSLIQSALPVSENQRQEPARTLLKDVPRVPAKAIPLALAPATALDASTIISDIFANRPPDRLVRKRLDDTGLTGDVVITAMVLLTLRIAGRAADFETEARSTLPELRRQRDAGGLQPMERLLVSTALCLYDLAKDISSHRSLLNELYSSDLDWHRSFSSSSPFLDHRYSDAPGNRYLRIPTGFIVLTAIYVTIGDERRFFSFPPVRTMLDDIKTPFAVHVGRDKNKAAAYFAWFTYVALSPARFLNTPSQSWLDVTLARFDYRRRDLTILGAITLGVCMLGLASSGFFLYEALHISFEQYLDKLIGSIGTALGAFLGLFRTRKR